MRLRSRFAALLELHFGIPASFAAEVAVKNDSTVAGTPSTVANFFVPGESTALWLTATCNGDVVAMQVYWASQFGGAPAQLEQALTLFAAGTFPTSRAALATIPGPTLSDGVVNEFRFLDPPTNAVPLQVPVTSGQTFVVSLKFLNQSSGNPFAPSVTFDPDGCQAGKNAVDASPGGWIDACAAGVTGDWVIRAVVDCAPASAVPTLEWPAGVLVLLVALTGSGWAALRASGGPEGGRPI